MLEKYLKTLSENLGQEMPPKNSQGSFSLLFSEHLKIVFSENPSGIHLQSPIAPCPQREKEEAFSMLLFANLFGQGTGGAVLALDEEAKDLTLSKTLTLDVFYETFYDDVEDFANYVEFWQKEIQKYNQEGSKPKGIL